MPEAGYETAFRAAILDPEVATPAGLASAFGGVPRSRFNVYRNNVTVSLIGALADMFPAIGQIVGEQRFADLARLFVRAHPPRSPLVFKYGADFPTFIESFTPAASMPYLADVARLERCWLDAYHAADAAPLAPGRLAELPPEALPRARFIGHPATALVQSRFAAVTIFNANRSDAVPARINAGIAEAGLVTRPAADVEVRSISTGNAAYIAALLEQATLAQAAEAAMAADQDFELSAAIGLTLESGAFTSVEAPRNT